MFTEQKLEQHYSKLPTDVLHTIREEYKWAVDECNFHAEEQIKYIEKILSLRGESLQTRTDHKILFLCKCGASRIVNTAVADDKIKLFIFEQYNVPCSKCRNINQYTWKYMD